MNLIGPYIDPISVTQAIFLLEKSQPVAIPTETVYGLAAPIKDSEAIRRVFELKKRPFFDPLIVHIDSFAQLFHVADPEQELVPILKSLADAFWPGPLTVVVRRREGLSPLITAGLDTVAVRVPRHPTALHIIHEVGPLAAPSANLFGKTSPTRAEHVTDAFQGLVPVVDGGPCFVGIESTIVLCQKPATLQILRQGMIQQKDIASHLQSKNFSVTWNSSIAYEGNAVLAPGTLKHHYMPQSPLVVSSDPLPPEQVLQQIFQKYSHRGNIALTSEPKENQQNEIPVLSQIDPHQIGYLELPLTDPTLCARLLYHEFHQKSKRYPLLFLYWPASHTGGDWAPIWERITKAATIRLGLFAQVT